MPYYSRITDGRSKRRLSFSDVARGTNLMSKSHSETFSPRSIRGGPFRGHYSSVNSSKRRRKAIFCFSGCEFPWNIIGCLFVGSCFLDSWTKLDIKVRFGSPHNPPDIFFIITTLRVLFSSRSVYSSRFNKAMENSGLVSLGAHVVVGVDLYGTHSRDIQGTCWRYLRMISGDKIELRSRNSKHSRFEEATRVSDRLLRSL